MESVKDLVVIGVAAGIVLALLIRADEATKVIGAVSQAYYGLISTVAGAAK